jgi:AcrR family transcriptional regulator
VTRRINQAVLELLVEGGIDACTFQNVAGKAGIERSTLYRRNPDRWPTIITAIIELADRETASFDTGSFRDDLANTLNNLTKVLTSPLGPALIEVAGALQAGVAPGQAERFWASRQQQLAPMFEAAIARGELPEDVDRDELFAMAAGPIYFRRFISAQPLTETWVRKVVDQVCDHYCRK